jgi:hypothetical protein
MHARRQPGDLTVQELFERGHELNGKRIAVVGGYVSGMEESALYDTGPQAKDLVNGFWRKVW